MAYCTLTFEAAFLKSRIRFCTISRTLYPVWSLKVYMPKLSGHCSVKWVYCTKNLRLLVDDSFYMWSGWLAAGFSHRQVLPPSHFPLPPSSSSSEPSSSEPSSSESLLLGNGGRYMVIKAKALTGFCSSSWNSSSALADPDTLA